VVLVVVEVVVVDVVVAQPPPPHASQQLEYAPTQALPPVDAVQRDASRRTLQRVVPSAFVRQHVTAPGLPHVERE
jgi:hypothetical protein